MGKRAAAPVLLEPQQRRSRRTLESLVAAAESLLNEGGLEAATIPRIASRARVATGSVYRRFPDKDALLKYVFQHFFEKVNRSNRSALDPALWARCDLRKMAKLLIRSVVAGHSQKRNLLRALLVFSLEHKDAAFLKRSRRMMDQSLDQMRALLMSRRNEISHPDPETAVSISLSCIVSALQQRLLAGKSHPLRRFTDEAIVEQLSSLLIRYLTT